MKIRNLIVPGLMALIVGISSCRDDFDFDLATENLSFSNDTVHLDTVFNHTNSQTFKLTVHNHQNDDVLIPRIFLSRGEASLFKLNVDGMPGYDFENVPIRKKDSIFIFVEIAAGEAPVNPLYEDEINFETTTHHQQIKLISYIEKALFYNTDQTEDYSLGNINWDNEYSRVIFGKVSADNVNIGPGTKVYFHQNAELNINGSVSINGTAQENVVFRTDRMDERSDSLPNMWGKIKLKSPNNTVFNKIDYAIIKGGHIGLEVEDSYLEISNTKILNNESIGLYAKNSNITGSNLVINNSDITAVGIEGGVYDFRHCTFANYHNIGQGAGYNWSLYLSNEGNPLNARFYNSIFYGRAMNAVQVEEGTTGNIQFDFNLIKGENPNGATNTLDEDPLFVNSGFGKNDLRLFLESPAQNAGSNSYIIPTDILGQARSTNPTLGAYEILIDPETLP